MSGIKGPTRRDPPGNNQPTKADMEEVIVVDATLHAVAVLVDGAPRKEPVKPTAWK